MSKDINSTLKILVARRYSGAELQSSGTGGHDVYSRTTSDPHRGRGDALMCSIIPPKAVREGYLEANTACVVICWS